MNFRNLQYFLAAADARNITHAARSLYISQQSLSSHIAKLEQELDVQLFERGAELKLTYAGERLALIARRICALEKEILQETGEISRHNRERLRLGVSHTCGRAILPSILPEFCARHPLTEIRLMEGNHTQLNEWLSAGEIEVLVGYQPIDVTGAEVFPILREQLYLACPVAFVGEDGLPEQAATQLQAFRDRPFILLKKGNRLRSMIDTYMEKNDFIPNLILETENIETAFALARQGMGVTVYPDLFLNMLHPEAYGTDSGIRLYPLSGEETSGLLAVAIMENAYHSPAVLDFLALCRIKAASWQCPAPEMP